MTRADAFLAALLAAAAPAVARAHDLWIERTADGFVLQGGHRGADPVGVDASRITAIRCARAGRPTHDVRSRVVAGGGAVRVAARCDVISASLDNGFYVLTPDGERNVPRTEAPDAVKSWRSRQFAKWLDVSSPAASEPIGDLVEIVPASDLVRAKVGEKVTVRVLLDGRPVAGAVVSIGHEPLAETGGTGEARVKVRHAGVESIAATLRRPLRAPEAETDVIEASLAFEVTR
jgi:hypothetical protein